MVFVDLDRCLLLDDSIGGFLARLIERGIAPKSAALSGAFAYTGYRLNWIDPEEMIYRGIAGLVKYDEDLIRRESQAFFDSVARFRYRRSVLTEIERHQAAGRPVYLLTGGLPYLPELIAGDLGLDGVCATRAEVDEHGFTGRVIDPPCVGAGKIVHAQKAARQIQQTLDGCWFYTDSYSDLPMLKVADHPVAVNPDRKLKKYSRQNKIPILY